MPHDSAASSLSETVPLFNKLHNKVDLYNLRIYLFVFMTNITNKSVDLFTLSLIG